MIELKVPDPETIPSTLRQKDQWVCWRAGDEGTDPSEVEGNVTVHPISPVTGDRAPEDDETTWTSFETAYATATAPETPLDGVGFYPTPNDPFIELTLGDCRDPETGVIDDWAQTIIRTLDSYTEVMCLTGAVRVLVAGTLPDWTFSPISLIDEWWLVPVTTDLVSWTPASLNERPAAVRAVYKARKLTDTPRETAALLSDVDIEEFGGLPSDPVVNVNMSDSSLIDKARKSSIGYRFWSLWNGDDSAYLTREEADLAFCCQLAYWTGGDGEWMDRLYRKSPRSDGQWNAIDPDDHTMYSQRMIRRAVELTDDYYTPRIRR